MLCNASHMAVGALYLVRRELVCMGETRCLQQSRPSSDRYQNSNFAALNRKSDATSVPVSGRPPHNSMGKVHSPSGSRTSRTCPACPRRGALRMQQERSSAATAAAVPPPRRPPRPPAAPGRARLRPQRRAPRSRRRRRRRGGAGASPLTGSPGRLTAAAAPQAAACRPAYRWSSDSRAAVRPAVVRAKASASASTYARSSASSSSCSIAWAAFPNNSTQAAARLKASRP